MTAVNNDNVRDDDLKTSSDLKKDDKSSNQTENMDKPLDNESDIINDESSMLDNLMEKEMAQSRNKKKARKIHQTKIAKIDLCVCYSDDGPNRPFNIDDLKKGDLAMAVDLNKFENHYYWPAELQKIYKEKPL